MEIKQIQYKIPWQNLKLSIDPTKNLTMQKQRTIQTTAKEKLREVGA